MSKSIEDAIDKIKDKDKKIEKFSQLLDGLESTADKKKLLWKEIYENAINDRECAGILFTDLFSQTTGNANSHAISGPILSKYLERMSKSNDQILKLAEIIQKAEDQHAVIDSDEIFEKIGN